MPSTRSSSEWNRFEGSDPPSASAPNEFVCESCVPARTEVLGEQSELQTSIAKFTIGGTQTMQRARLVEATMNTASFNGLLREDRPSNLHGASTGCCVLDGNLMPALEDELAQVAPSFRVCLRRRRG